MQIEAVENHMPEVIIVDEIGTAAEALACRTIAERGVQLIGTAHGQLLENLIKNPTLSDLVGGVQVWAPTQTIFCLLTLGMRISLRWKRCRAAPVPGYHLKCEYSGTNTGMTSAVQDTALR